MTRTETTDWLYRILFESRFSGMGKYYACEVTLDTGTISPRRIDVLQFVPPRATYIGDIEKGEFICYEVKSCLEDIMSGHGLNFIGEKNYIVTTLDTYKKFLEKIAPRDEENTFFSWYNKDRPWDVQRDFGVMIACPKGVRVQTYFAEPEKYADIPEDDPSRWSMQIARSVNPLPRKRSTTELLFCMLRAKENYSTTSKETSDAPKTKA